MDAKSVISKKREKKELTRDEIRYFIGGVTKGDVSETQYAALLSYIYINGLTEKEILEFCTAMALSGDVLDLSEISKNIVLKHSTGGVGDKSSLLLMPVMAALGLKYPQISTKGFGITGSMIDRLEAIPGFDAEITVEEFKKIINDVGVGIIAQDLNLAPAENKMYRIRNQIGCSDSLPLIALSLMSMKLASGGDKFVFDITCGRGTYIKNREQAKKLAHLLVKLGKALEKETRCVITAMDEPIGYAIGHNLEIKEVINSLKGSMPHDLGEKVVALGSVMLALGTENKNLDQNAVMIREVIRNGSAYEKFKDMVRNQYGDVSYVENPEKFKEASHIMPVFSSGDGYIESIDSDMVASLAIYLGAGRMKKEEQISKTAGIVLKKKIGDTVTAGEIIAYVHTDEEYKVLNSTKNLTDAFKYTDKKPSEKSKIYEII